LEKIVLALREERKERYLQLWSNIEDAQKLPLNTEQYLYYFGDVRRDRSGNIITNSLTGSGVVAAICGADRSYDCFDLRFRQNGGEKWILHHDPADLTQVLASNADGTLRFMLEEKYVQPMALVERKEGDSEQLHRIKQFNENKLLQHITDFRSLAGETVRNFFDENPMLNDTLTKHLIADSRGQHKNRLSNQRIIEAAQKAEIKIAKRQEREECNTFSQERREYVASKVNIEEYAFDE
jgi:hypothetical protein